jgi:alpha/beta superfamily hydrolase
MYPFAEMATYTVPKLVVQGTADDVCKPEVLAGVFPGWAEPKRLLLVDDASHFFDKHLAGLAQAMLEGIR